MKNFRFLFVLSILTFFYSCNEELTTSLNDELIPYSDQDFSSLNVASFESVETLNLDINEYLESGTLPYQVIEMKKTTKSENVDYEEADEDSLIVSDSFRQFLNEKNEIIVGDVFLRITEQGTFFTSANKACWLDSLVISDQTIENCININEALGFERDSCLYKVQDYDSLYVYDTFRKISKNLQNEDINLKSSNINLKLSTTEPAASDYVTITSRGTLLGKGIDAIFGYSISEQNNFSSKYRTDAKFYSVDYLVKAETGVKTKTQKKGWTGIWNKTNSDEIRSGYRVLALKEKFSLSFLNRTLSSEEMENNLTSYYVNGENIYLLSCGITTMPGTNKKYLTFNFLNMDSDITYDDLKMIINWGLNYTHYNYSYTDVAVRSVPNSISTNTVIYAIDQIKRDTNTDKVTYIVANDIGFKVGYSYEKGSGFSLDNMIVESPVIQLEYANGCEMYGVALRGTVWKGVICDFQ